MKQVKLHNRYFKLFIESNVIISKIEHLADKINLNFADKNPIFLCVLNGSFIFASELIRRFKYNCEVSFVKLSSYEGIDSSGKINNLIGLNENFEGKI